MYEENEVRFSWGKFLLKLLIFIVIIVLLVMLLPLSNNKIEKNGHSKIFNNNLVKFKEVGNNYFNKDNLPKEKDEEVKVTLNQLINAKKIDILKGSDKKVCNNDKSYIKAYKKNIGYELEVYLECGEEKETSHIYLGCFDDCNITTTKTTTTKTTTKKASTSKKTTTANKQKTTTKKVTTTTTTTKKYAVIFNENGGSKINTIYVLKGNKLSRPSDPVKEGFKFNGWYLNGQLFDFNTPINDNIVLIAKWTVDNENKPLTYVQNVYSLVNTYYNAEEINTRNVLKVPSNIANYSNIKIKSVTYIKNITSDEEIKIYTDNHNNYFDYDDGINKTITKKDLGTLNNIEIENYTWANNDKAIKWSGNVQTKCETENTASCTYGIIYRVIWEYNA